VIGGLGYRPRWWQQRLGHLVRPNATWHPPAAAGDLPAQEFEQQNALCQLLIKKISDFARQEGAALFRGEIYQLLGSPLFGGGSLLT
jgi:hypothetical protein